MENNRHPGDSPRADECSQLPAKVLRILEHSGNGNPDRDLAVPFARVMREALYGPEGYYRTAVGGRIGKRGDFFTSVSVGPVFGRLLAQHCYELWLAMNRPGRFSLVEQGADSGQLMADILGASSRLDPSFASALVPWTIEPLAELADTQRASIGSSLQSVPSPRELPTDLPPGLLYSNELIDALPVCRVRHHGAGHWQELHLTAEGFRWLEPATPGLSEQLANITARHAIPAGYETEVHIEALAWMRALADSPFRGHILAIDYGFLADDYYHPDRTCGTLQAYKGHNKVALEPHVLGEVDLTAHVNFSDLLETALELGIHGLGLPSQETFLTRLAHGWLLDIESRSSDFSPTMQDDHASDLQSQLRQFQTLTHPGMLGRKFHALCLWKPSSECAPDDTSLSQPPTLSALG